MVLNMKQ